MSESETRPKFHANITFYGDDSFDYERFAEWLADVFDAAGIHDYTAVYSELLPEPDETAP